MTPRRWRLGRILAVAAALVLAVAGALLLGLPLLVDLPRVQTLLRAEVSRLLDRPVHFERVSLGYRPFPAVRVTRLVVGNPDGFGPDPLLSVEEARVRLRLLPLLRGRLQFGEVTLDRPRVVVEQRGDGTWNLPVPRAARPAPAAPLALVSRVHLRDAHLELRVPGGEAGWPPGVHRVDRLDLVLEDLGWTRPIAVQLGARLLGGSLVVDLQGDVGALAEAGGDLAAVPVRLALRFRVMEVPRPAAAEFAVTGIGEGTLRVEGRLGHLAGDGRLTFARLTVVHRPAACTPATPRALAVERVELPLRLAGPELAVQPFAFRVAGGSVRGQATLTWRAPAPSVRLRDVRVQGVDAERLLGEFLCLPYAVAGRLDGSGELAFEGSGEDLRGSARGRWRVEVGPGRLTGPAALTLLAGAVRAARVLSIVNVDLPRALFAFPLEFESLTAAGTVGDGQVRVRQVTLTGRRLRVAGHGTYGLAETRLDFRLTVETGRTAFEVKVGGTAQEPSYVPVPRPVLKGVTDVLRGKLR